MYYKFLKKVRKYHGYLQYMWSGVYEMDGINGTLILTSLCMKNDSERRWSG